MMKNKKGTIILSIILAVQFIIPLSVWGYETYKNKELEEKGYEVKLLVDYVTYDENRVEFEVVSLRDAMYSDENNYVVFENNGNDFSTIKEVKNKPETDLYIGTRKLYSLYRNGWCFKYDSEITKEQYEYDWFQLYNREIEKDNIARGYCEGPETQAYAVFKIYKNRFKVVDIYIDGMPVDEIIVKYKNGEIYLSRYDYNYDKYEDSEVYYDKETEEYVTEPVVA